jgi:hypothetical protein
MQSSGDGASVALVGWYIRAVLGTVVVKQRTMFAIEMIYAAIPYIVKRRSSSALNHASRLPYSPLSCPRL